MDASPDALAGGTLLWIALGVVLPVLAVTATAFAKISVVLGALRGGLGAPEVLPLPVLTGLAALLTVVVMLPTARQAGALAGSPGANPAEWAQAAERAWPVWEGFLERHTKPEDRVVVEEAVRKLEPGGATEAPAPARPLDRVLAFLLSELTAAFQLAVAVLLPFLVVDLLVANTLVVLGFQLLSPAVVALPFKLVLFVAVGGWGLLVRGLVGAYA